jgi:hypothetical protein
MHPACNRLIVAFVDGFDHFIAIMLVDPGEKLGVVRK